MRYLDRSRVQFTMRADVGSLPTVAVTARHPDFPDFLGHDVVPCDSFGGSLSSELETELMLERAVLDLRRQVRTLNPAQRFSIRNALLAAGVVVGLILLSAAAARLVGP